MGRLAAPRGSGHARATANPLRPWRRTLDPEREIHWLAGYEASQPVRIGNAAIEQHQLDVFGEVELAFRREIEQGFVTPHAHWNMRRAMIEHLVAVWREPDEGIWEVRGGPSNSLIPKPWPGPRWIARSTPPRNMGCQRHWITGARFALTFSMSSAYEATTWTVVRSPRRWMAGTSMRACCCFL